MKEEFLHFVWNTRSFNFLGLKTTDGKPVEILNFGQANERGGPDFKNALLIIDGIRWAGNVEMHLVASEWDRHGHSGDPNYESVILHVVLEEDKPVRMNGRRIPCIELGRRIKPGLMANYGRLMQLRTWVPCQELLPTVGQIEKSTWIERMLIERLEHKVERMHGLLQEWVNDWQTVLIKVVISAFGFGSSKHAFERLSRIVTARQILQQGSDVGTLEAMLFGAAGMLNRIFVDTYPQRLQRTFNHLQNKYDLQCMNAHAWEWGKVRPANFPTVRLAQLAQVLTSAHSLLTVTTEAVSLETIRGLFTVRASEYWDVHSDFDRASKARVKAMGRQSIDTIMINAILPFLFYYGKYRSDDPISDRAVNFMADMAPENNRITQKWIKCGMPNRHAGDSQGLIHLKRNYCDAYRCTSCSIGYHILLDKERDVHV